MGVYFGLAKCRQIGVTFLVGVEGRRVSEKCHNDVYHSKYRYVTLPQVFHCSARHQVNVFGACSLSKPEHIKQRKTIQQSKTISDNVLTAYIFTIKGNSTDLSFQYTTRWQPVQSLRMRSWRSWFTPISCHGIFPQSF